MDINNTENYLNEKYFIYQELGSGAYAKVRLIEEKSTKKKYALKIILKDPYFLNKGNYFKREVSLLEKVYHSNLIKLYKHEKYTYSIDNDNKNKKDNSVVEI